MIPNDVFRAKLEVAHISPIIYKRQDCDGLDMFAGDNLRSQSGE